MEFKGIVYHEFPKAMYVHVPFCASICAYCDFARVKYTNVLFDKWLAVIRKEIDSVSTNEMHTIYIGGGTPSSLSIEQLDVFLGLLDRFSGVEEYTIEVNPETLSLEKCKMLKKHGINRISMGVQSFQSHLLKMMDRKHCVDDIMQCLAWFKEVGIDNCSIDLMYALPKQSIEDWENDLAIACSLDVSHISLYSLTIEPNSKFGRWGVEPVDGDLEFEMYEYAIDYLSSHGFEHYEVSNFARNGLCSKHNIAYWKYDDFYGIGLGSSGKLGKYRYTQTMNFVEYFNETLDMEIVELDDADERFEAIMMGLRMLEGICIEEYNRRYKVDLMTLYEGAISENIRRGWLEIVDGNMRVTRDGLYLLHEVLLEFMND